MRIEFHVLIAGNLGYTKLQLVRDFETTPERVRVECDEQFRELVDADAEVAPLVVVWNAMNPVVIATELIHAWPTSIREKQGKPARELIWVSDPITSA